MMNVQKEIELRVEMSGLQGHAFFLKYFAKHEEFYPMEIKPSHIKIEDYDLKYDKTKEVVYGIYNKKLDTDVKFYDMNLQTF